MVQMSGGEALAKSLVGEGVEVAFGLPGIQICGIVAALRDEPGIRMVTTRHEQATKYMADGYAATPSRQESQVWRWWSPEWAFTTPRLVLPTHILGPCPFLSSRAKCRDVQSARTLGQCTKSRTSPAQYALYPSGSDRYLGLAKFQMPCSKHSDRCAPVVPVPF